ncbi:glycosyltransferase family 4 protein [Planktomarina temperata]|nr:glycosyltransferase family 4 protein [Planktomarina temperata]
MLEKSILYISSNFTPESNAPALRANEHAAVWAAKGLKVTVICPFPNFPNGKVYDGFQHKLYERETIKSVIVYRVFTVLSPNRGVVLRLVSFLSFTIMAFFMGLFLKRHDVVLGSSPQFFSVTAAWLLAKLKRSKFIFEVRDIWPESAVAVGIIKKGNIFRLLEVYERFLYRQSDLIITVSNGIAKDLLLRGVNKLRLKVITNGVSFKKYYPQEKSTALVEQLCLSNKIVFGYIGTHGRAHGLENILRVAETLKNYHDVAFIFVGGGEYKKQLENLIEKKNLFNVISVPRVVGEDVPKYINLCDVAIVSLIDSKVFETVIPSKVFENMAMGVPTLCIAPNGQATELINKYNCGWTVFPNSDDELRNLILRLRENRVELKEKSENSLSAGQYFDREKLACNLLEYIEDL